jgi:DNA-binding CsgD family transcriptional regulator
MSHTLGTSVGDDRPESTRSSARVDANERTQPDEGPETRPRASTIEVQWHEDLRRVFGLTTMQARVTVLLADRNSNREIAAALSVTEHTARRHTERVLNKLRIHSRTDVRAVFRQLACGITPSTIHGHTR